jgi:hypothetical protein
MSIPFARHCQQIETHLKTRYGIRVVTRDIPDPLTGDLDGLEIHINYAVTPEQRLFLLAHFFGHTVQWNTDPSAFETGRQYQPPIDEKLFPAILAYEREAASYGLAMLHEADVTDTDEWFSAYSECDQTYLLISIAPGKKAIPAPSGPKTFL